MHRKITERSSACGMGLPFARCAVAFALLCSLRIGLAQPAGPEIQGIRAIGPHTGRVFWPIASALPGNSGVLQTATNSQSLAWVTVTQAPVVIGPYFVIDVQQFNPQAPAYFRLIYGIPYGNGYSPVAGVALLSAPPGISQQFIPLLKTQPNTVSNLLLNPPDFAMVINSTGQISTYDPCDPPYGWSDPTMLLQPGELITICNTSSNNWTNLFGGDILTATSFASTYSTPFKFAALAGRASQGSDDGVGSAAQFRLPKAIAAGSLGGVTNLYLADSGNHVIRKLTPGGTVSTVAGLAGTPGSADGAASDARFSFPGGLAADQSGNVFVADTGNHAIRRITNGVVSTIAGQAGYSGSADGPGDTARFFNPSGLAVDSNGTLYVADTYNHTIRKLTPSGSNWLATTLAGAPGAFGFSNSTGSSAQFFYPSDLALDNAGNMYVADCYNSAIRKVTAAGVVTALVGAPANRGFANGTNAAAQFFLPRSVTVDSSGTLYVADTENDTIRKITPSGTDWVVTTLAGSPGNPGTADGTQSAARFDHPSGVALVGNRLYVSDSSNSLVRIIFSGGVVGTFAGSIVSAGSTDSPGRFYKPSGVAVDGSGNVYVADSGNHTIRQVTQNGLVFTPAGSSGASGTNDGVGTGARFSSPSAVAVDSGGNNVYVADTGNHAIRKYSTADGTVSTLAGLPGTSGTNDGSGSAARFNGPLGLALDASGNIYVGDTGNGSVRKVTPAGAVTTLAGGLGSPWGVAVDGTGNVYVAGNSNHIISKMSPAGVVTPFVGGQTSYGNSSPYGSLDGTPAQFNSPSGLALDPDGNLYVADAGNHTIRLITAAGIVSTVAGLAGSPGSDNGIGSDAHFNNPLGVAVDSAGNLYVADLGNNQIREGTFILYAPAQKVPFTPPDATGQLNVTLLPSEADGQWRLPYDVRWRSSGETATNLPTGNYTIEFRSIPGYLVIHNPLSPVAVSNGATTSVTIQYLPTVGYPSTNTGALSVNFGPSSPPAGAAWRFLGEGDSAWRGAGTVSSLLPDIYYVEFKPVSNYVKPPNLGVLVAAGPTPTLLSTNYLLASPVTNVALPIPVPPGNIADVADYPYGFNGQIQSDLTIGYGSGVAVQPTAVLTAAHLVFDTHTLSYASHVYWLFRKEAGVYDPPPQEARGWYVLGGYARARTNDSLAGLGPDQSSAESRNFDVAALSFSSYVAGGGHGGYLPSDATPNPWLTGSNQKMLVGYPVDGSQFGDASIVPGQMYETGPSNSPLVLATDQVNEPQQVYTANWFLSYAGNSGGPLYVKFNGYLYPAGVYIGTLNSAGTYYSLVRAIDSNVVNLITLAGAYDLGTNHPGGGVILVTPIGVSTSNPGYVQVQLGPQAAVQAGAAWWLSCTNCPTNYSTATNFTLAVTTTNALSVVFRPVPGWNLPPGQTLSVIAGQLLVTNAFYSVVPPTLSLIPGLGLGMTGTINTAYRLERVASLSSGSWLPLRTNTLSNGFNLLLPWPLTNGPASFYRAVWLP